MGAPKPVEDATATRAQELRPRDLEDAQSRLEASPQPSAQEAAQLLAYLSGLEIDAATIARTKIGLTVNKMRKHYAGERALVEKALQLVERWKSIWKSARQ